MKSLLLILLVPLLLPAQVTQEKLRAAQDDPNTWLMYGRDYQATRYSPLSQIDTSNIARLTPAWIRQARASEPFEATPLVFDGMMYVTGADNHGMALDLLTGKEIWSYGKAIPKGVQGCCGTVNRGFAALGNRLFKVNYEAKIVALDSKTGEQLWETVIDDFKKGYSATVAPIVVKNLVVIGIAGAEFGTRGFVDAYDADTGKRVVALLHRARTRRAWRKHLEVRRLAAGRRIHVGYRLLRSRTQPHLLGHRQSRPRHERRRPSRRQSLHLQHDRAGCRHRKTEVALSIHAA